MHTRVNATTTKDKGKEAKVFDHSSARASSSSILHNTRAELKNYADKTPFFSLLLLLLLRGPFYSFSTFYLSALHTHIVL